MQLPIKAHYAALAMLTMAQQYVSSELVTAKAISAEHSIPNQFLVQILQQLRAAGLITSTRGSSGGFRLTRAPQAISLADIVDAVCATQTVREIAQHSSSLNELLLQVWDQAAEQQRNHLRQLSLAELLEREVQMPGAMFYI